MKIVLYFRCYRSDPDPLKKVPDPEDWIQQYVHFLIFSLNRSPSYSERDQESIPVRQVCTKKNRWEYLLLAASQISKSVSGWPDMRISRLLKESKNKTK